MKWLQPTLTRKLNNVLEKTTKCYWELEKKNLDRIMDYHNDVKSSNFIILFNVI